MFRKHGLLKVDEKAKDKMLTDTLKKQIEYLQDSLGKEQESGFMFRKVFENSPYGMVMVNSSFRFIRVNKSFCSLIGYSEDELLELGFPDITFRDDLESNISEVRRLMKGELPVFNTEKRYIRKNGEITWCFLTVTSINDQAGNHLFNLAIIEDISERKRAEQQLRNLTRLNSLVSHLGNIIIKATSKNDLFNRACEVAVKYGEFQMAWIGMLDKSTGNVNPVASSGIDAGDWPLPVPNIFSEEQKTGLVQEAFRLSETVTTHSLVDDKRMSYIGTVFKKLGFHSSAVIPLREFGDMVGVIVLISKDKDFFGRTEQLELLGDLEKNLSYALDNLERERLKSQWVNAFEHCAHGIAIGVPGDNYLLTCNPAFARLIGMTVKEAENRLIKDFYAPDEVQKVLAWIEEADYKGKITYESRMVRKDGSLYDVQMDLVSVKDSNGKVLYRVATQQDISQRKRMEEELRKSTERFTQIVEQSQTVVWEIDASGLYTYISPVAEKVWGTNLKELVGLKHYYDIHPAKGRDSFRAATLEVIKRGDSFFNLPNPIERPDGRIIWVATNGIAVRDSNHFVIGYRGADNDITELKDAQDSLNLAQKIAGMGSWEYDLNNNLIKWSDNLYKIYDLDESEEITYEKYLAMIHPDDRGKVEEGFKILLDQKNPVSIDLRIISPDGKMKWLQNNIVPVFRNEKLVALHGVNIDISSQKEREAIIQEQKDTLNGIINSLPDLFFIFDREGKYLDVFCSNKGSLLMPKEEIIGRKITEIFDEEMAGMHMSHIAEAIKKKQIITYEYPVRIGDEVSYWEARLSPIDDNRIVAVSRDITHKVKSDAELKRLSVAIEQSPVAVIITDLNTNIVYVNPAFTETTGFTWFEITGKNIKQVKSGFSSQQTYNKIVETVKSGKEWSGELLHKKKNGENYWDSLSASPIYDEKGMMSNLLVVSQDITERKATERRIIELNTSLERRISERTIELAETNRNLLSEVEERRKIEIELENARKEAENANRAKSEFLANMSHEIRTPMNAIIGYSELLGSMISDTNQRDYLKSIKSSGETLLTLINDILDLSKIEAGKLDLDPEFVRSYNFFHDFERIFAFKTSEKGIRFATKLSPDLPPFIFIDDVRLRQVILNLLSNAVKFTEKGSVELDVTTKYGPKTMITGGNKTCELEIRVTDTGIGIPEESQSKIFNSFYQVKGKMSHEGTGLGLAISQRLVQMMNGTISFESVAGKGTTFIVRLPMVQFTEDYAMESGAVAINPDFVVFEKSTILVVDDIQENRDVISDILGRTSIVCMQARGGEEALKILENNGIDLIITDIKMPEMDGFEFLKLIRSNPKTKDIPVIAYSAQVMKQQKEEILQQHFAGLLTKPVRISDLYVVLTSHLKFSESTPDIESLEQSINIQDTREPGVLLSSMKGELLMRWQKYGVRQPISEIKQFGRDLKETGEKHSFKPLIDLGNSLSDAADSFNIEGILRLLGTYPELIINLEKAFPG
ncbi:MAG: PAS domain S-box protein [Bacteroidales bacterium]